MQPLGDGHLLTIGRDATDEGFVQGLALQIFDVTDPTSPTLQHRYVFRDEWGYSDANWDHKAFTYFGARELLAFPYVAYGDRWDSFRSSLEVFHVDAVNGFWKLGSVDHTSLLQNECVDGNTFCREYGLNIRPRRVHRGLCLFHLHWRNRRQRCPRHESGRRAFALATHGLTMSSHDPPWEDAFVREVSGSATDGQSVTDRRRRTHRS